MTLFTVSLPRLRMKKSKRQAAERELKELRNLDRNRILPEIIPSIDARIAELVAMLSQYGKQERLENARRYSDSLTTESK